LVAADVGTRGLLRRLGVEQLVSGLARLFGQEIRGKVIAWDHVHMVGPGAHPLQLALARDRLTTMRPADLADIAGQLSAAERAHLFLSLPDETAAEAMSELEPELQVAVLNDLPEEDAADIVEEMVPDEAADLLGDLPPEQARDILELMEPEEAAEVKALMQFAEDTAGGLMTTEWVEVPEHLTADAAIARLRELAPVAETIFYIYVVDADERLVGVLSLRDLILMPGEEAIASRVVRDAVRVHLNATAEDTAQLINKYGLLAVPVVDDAGKLRGIVTVDDVMDLVIPAVRRRRQLRR
jgi:Mg2+ transporter MgtE